MSKNIGKNRSIMCTVTSCRHHCDKEDFCSLDRVQIGTHEHDPATEECTDCQSFSNVNPYEQSMAEQESEHGSQPGSSSGLGWEPGSGSGSGSSY